MEGINNIEEIKILCDETEKSKDKTKRNKRINKLIQKILTTKLELKYEIFESMINNLNDSEENNFDLYMTLYKNNPSQFGILRQKLLNNIIKKNIDSNLNESIIKDISIILNDGKDLLYLNNIQILIQFLFFKCLFKFKMFNNEKLWIIIENIIKNNFNGINKIQLDILCNICVMLSFNIKDKYEIKNDILEIVINICGFYLLNCRYNNYLISKNIVLMLLYNFPFKDKFLLNFFKSKSFTFFNIINELLRDYDKMEIHFCIFNIEKLNLFYNKDFIEINTKENKHLFKKFENKHNIKNIIKSNSSIINEHIFDFIQFLTKEQINSEFIQEGKNFIEIDDIIFFEYIKKIISNIKNDNHEFKEKIIIYLILLIKKNGNQFIEEWNYIFKIINENFIIKREKNYELSNDKIEEIFEEIEKLYFENKYYGNINDLIEIMNKISFFKNETLINFKMNLLLKDRKNFLLNLEKIILLIVNNNNANFIYCKNNLMEIILNNYNYSYNSEGEESERVKLIESLMLQYYLKLLQSFINDNSNCILLSYLISEIISKTKDKNLFKQFLDMFVHINFDFGNQENGISRNFSINIIRDLFEKLCLLWDKDKLLFFLKYFFGKNNISDKNVLKFSLKLIKHFIIDDSYEIITQNNILSPLILNYKSLDIQKQKEKLEKNEFKKFKSKFYNPFIQFKHIKIYKALNHQLLQNKKNNYLIKHILKFYVISLKSFFFLKDVNIDEFIQIIVKDKDFSELYINKEITYFIFKIFSLLNYQINSNLISDNNSINNKSTFINDNLSLYTDIIFTLLKTWNKINEKITLYLKNKNSIIQNFFDSKFKDSNSIRSNQFTLNISLTDICEILKILKLYLSSLTKEINQSKNEISYYSKKSLYNDCLNKKLDKNYGNNDLNNIIKDVFLYITENLFLIYLSKEYSFAIISFFYEIKDLLFYFGDEKIINAIYILLLIGWPNYQENIINSFENNYQINYVPKFLKKEKLIEFDFNNKNKDLFNSENGIQLIQFYSDITCLYYLEKIEFSQTMFKVLSNIFQEEEKENNREVIFLSLAKWNLLTRTKRTNISYLTIEKNSKVFLGNNNLIIINPKNKLNYDIIFKNFFADIFYNVSYGYEKNKKSKDKNNYILYIRENHIFSQKELFNDENELEEININLKDLLFQLITNTGGTVEDYIELSEEYKLKVKSHIYQLDLFTPFLIYFCGIIYFPNIMNYTLEDILFYKNEVSSKYIYFLSKIGDLYDINLKENSLIEIGNKMKKNEKTQYILMYNDSLCQIIFHVSNLLFENNLKDILFNDEVCLIWIENPNIDLNLFFNQILNDQMLIFIFIFPKTETHYLIKRYYSKGCNEIFKSLIDKIFLDEIIININNINSIYLLLRMIIQIKDIIKYQKSNLQYLNSNNQSTRQLFGKNVSNHNQIQETNFEKRKQIIKDIIYNFKK